MIRATAREERALPTLAQSITGAVRGAEVMHQIVEGALSVSGAAGAYVEQVASVTGEVEIVAASAKEPPWWASGRHMGARRSSRHSWATNRSSERSSSFADRARTHSRKVSSTRALADLASIALQRLVALSTSERRRAEAEAAVRSRDEVLSVVSHDLRNPASTVAMATSLLIAEAHRGHVSVESTPGVGSTFFLVLPAAKECD